LLSPHPDDESDANWKQDAGIVELFLDLSGGLLGLFRGRDYRATLDRMIALHGRTSSALVRERALLTIRTIGVHGHHYADMPDDVRQAANDFLNSLVTKQ
jgi:hypothetical protein